MAMRLTKAVTVVIDTQKFALNDLVAQAKDALRVGTDEQVMVRLTSIYEAKDQRDRDTATLELSVEKRPSSPQPDPRGPNA